MNIQTQDHGPFPGYPKIMRWSAIDLDTFDGAPDGDTRTGWGHTEDEAIHDLKCQLIEEGP